MPRRRNAQESQTLSVKFRNKEFCHTEFFRAGRHLRNCAQSSLDDILFRDRTTSGGLHSFMEEVFFPAMKFLVTTLTLVGTLVLSAAPLGVTALRTEHRVSPTGVGTAPRLSWQLVSDERGKSQTAYEILAASNPEKLDEQAADLWKSGKQNIGVKHLVPWKGESLKDVSKVHWKVRVWDEEGKPGKWSEAAVFQVDGSTELPAPGRISTFESSSPELNALYAESVELLGKQLAAFSAGDPTALGLGDQVHRASRAMLYHFDAVPHLTRWLRLMDEHRTKDLTFTLGPKSQKVGSLGSEGAIAAHHPVWWMGGDSVYPKERWKLYEGHMMAREKNDRTFQGTQWGEAAPTEGMTAEYLDLLSLAFTTRLVRELALPAQEPLNAIRFQDYAARIKKSFQNQYLTPEETLTVTSQTARAFALRSAVLEREQQSRVVADLVASLSKDGLQVGPIGAFFLPGVLSLTGNQDKAVALLEKLNPEQRKTFIGNGVSEWLMAYLAGIDSNSPGFQQLLIAPRIPANDSLSWVKASCQAPSGLVSVHWQKLPKGGIQVDYTIPVGAFARVNLPASKDAAILEGGKDLTEVPAIEVVSRDDKLVSLISKSGSYSIMIR